MEVGKLYRCEEYFLLLFTDPDTAARLLPAAPNGGNPAIFAAYWSNQFGKPISYVEKNVPLLVIQNKEEYIEVLVEDKKGWIIDEDWLEIKEIDHA